ncbi:MAG: hypothetical protein HY860_07075 [Chlamydiales bacterium]|nr:hypothetical protein [Chlamydiales bacterium]
MKKQRILILTLTFGGGHLQAAKAKKEEVLSKDPHAIIYEVDVFTNWVSERLSNRYVEKWNDSQRTGNIAKLEWFIKCQPLADKIFWPIIFLHACYTLITKNIDHIIDTQNLGTSAILAAVRLAKKFTSKIIIVEKVITELPTEQVTHFFKPIKGLSENSKKIIRLISPAPLLKENQTAENFWQEQCGLSERSVNYVSLPLRPSFMELKQKQHNRKKMDLSIHTQSEEDHHFILETMRKGSIVYKNGKKSIQIHINPEDRVSILMLGSRPNEHATLEYIKHFINQLISTKQTHKKDLLFVFCSSDKSARGTLLQRVHHLVVNAHPYPTALTVIPMAFQDDKVIAPLFFRSDATLTRSGGLTSMELLTVCEGKIWIHSEHDKLGRTKATMPHWEEGNAYYLKQKKGAEFITPENFESVCGNFFA